MSLTSNEALDALKEIDRTENRSSEAFHGQFIAPYLFVWGVIWLIGYGASAINPEWSNSWIILGPVGGIISAALGFRTKGKGSGEDRSYALSALALAVAIFVFFLVSFAIMTPTNGNQVGAFIPLVIGLIYAVSGILPGMRRMLMLGTALIVLTSVGYFFVAEYFMAWMAVIGSGALLLGGFWVRNA